MRLPWLPGHKEQLACVGGRQSKSASSGGSTSGTAGASAAPVLHAISAVTALQVQRAECMKTTMPAVQRCPKQQHDVFYRPPPPVLLPPSSAARASSPARSSLPAASAEFWARGEAGSSMAEVSLPLLSAPLLALRLTLLLRRSIRTPRPSSPTHRSLQAACTSLGQRIMHSSAAGTRSCKAWLHTMAAVSTAGGPEGVTQLPQRLCLVCWVCPVQACTQSKRC